MKRKEKILKDLAVIKRKQLAEKHGSLNPIFCGGCGHFTALNSIYNTMYNLKINYKNLVVVSGIGCSGRSPGFIKSFGFHGVHGRALPIATGVKLANPKLDVIVIGGDGDGLGIGGGHLPHAARMNINITYLLLDNSLYGLTKGQAAATTPFGQITPTTPYGNPGHELDPIKLSLVQGATFVARGFSGYPDELNDMVTEGVKHKGFSLIHVLSPCVTFNKSETYDLYYKTCEQLPKKRDLKNLQKAIGYAAEEKNYLGIFYQKKMNTLEDNFQNIIKNMKKL